MNHTVAPRGVGRTYGQRWAVREVNVELGVGADCVAVRKEWTQPTARHSEVDRVRDLVDLSVLSTNRILGYFTDVAYDPASIDLFASRIGDL